jgi:hypothetical protein
MKPLSRRLALTVLGVLTFGVLVTLGAGSAVAKGGHDRPADKVVLFASDGPPSTVATAPTTGGCNPFTLET